MGNALYETWWMNPEEGGIFYRNQWYSNEEELNNAGYYIVYSRDLYLGARHFSVKYQKNLYLLNDEYFQYDILHSQGYSESISSTYMYADTKKMYVYQGYYNPVDGYFADGNWYSTSTDIVDAGYQFLDDCIDQFIRPLPEYNICGGTLSEDSSASYCHPFMYSMTKGDIATIPTGELVEFTPQIGGTLYWRESQAVVYPDYKWPLYTGQSHDLQYAGGTLRESTIRKYDTQYIEQFTRTTMKIDD